MPVRLPYFHQNSIPEGVLAPLMKMVLTRMPTNFRLGVCTAYVVAIVMEQRKEKGVVQKDRHIYIPKE
jgi:hypothetical protein